MPLLLDVDGENERVRGTSARRRNHGIGYAKRRTAVAARSAVGVDQIEGVRRAEAGCKVIATPSIVASEDTVAVCLLVAKCLPTDLAVASEALIDKCCGVRRD